jgi:lipopolysaccharide transport system ATP-binding protein
LLLEAMPDDIIIRAENVGKRYTLGQSSGTGGYRKFSDTLISAAKIPLRWLQPSSFSPQPSPEDFWALRDLSFDIHQGEVVGIIGRNGAGKSTLLKLLSRITEPTTGRITLNGRIASLLEVGTGFHPELTGRENIFLNGAILGMGKAEIKKRFDEIVDFAEVEQFLDTPVKRYSSGMYVRLAFAVAAHLESEVLIVDEVLTVGDAKFQKKCLGRIEDVTRTGRTVLLVSHQMEVIKRLATTGLLLNKGSLAMQGRADEVVKRYLSDADTNQTLKVVPGRAGFQEVVIDQQRLNEGDLEVRLRFSSPEVILEPTIGLVVHGVTGTPICGSNTRMHPGGYTAKPTKEGEVTFSLAKVPLVSGEYTLSLWLNDGAGNLQYLPHAQSFIFQDPTPPEQQVDATFIGSCKITPAWTFA